MKQESSEILLPALKKTTDVTVKMATFTVTESETMDSDTRTVIKFNPNQCSFKRQETRVKVNKNGVMRKSAKKCATSDTKSNPTSEKGNVQIPASFSSPNLDGDADSAIGSEDELPKEMSDLDLRQDNESSAQEGSSSLQSAPGNGNKQDYSDSSSGENTDLRTDGPQSDAATSNIVVDDNMQTTIQSSISTSPVLHHPQDGMSDFVILHTDEDMEAACAYKNHLHSNDIGIGDLTVDLFSNIDAGKSQFRSLPNLYDNYRCILTYVTDNLENDNYCKFLQEILLNLSLEKEANGREDRLVPVFTNTSCGIPEIRIINGLQYFKFHSEKQFIRNLYIESVKRLVHKGRKLFP